MNDSIIKTLSVAVAVCLVCSLFVSFAAVNLRDTQNLNKINDQRVKVLQAAGIYDEANTNIEEQFSVLEAMFIDFSNNGKNYFPKYPDCKSNKIYRNKIYCSKPKLRENCWIFITNNGY